MEIVIETCLDSIKMLPFLFFAFLLIEFLEYYSGGMSGKLLKKVGKAGPVVGAYFWMMWILGLMKMKKSESSV